MSEVIGGPRHLALVGMMGAGKSTVGRALAERTGRRFVDLDEMVEAHTGQSVTEVFRTEGEEGFRRVESDLLATVLGEAASTVLATGGGAVCLAENRERLAEMATTIWLRAALSTLEARLDHSDDRPLLAGGDLPVTLEQLAHEREALYHEAAAVVVDTDGLEPHEVIQRILTSAVLAP